ncbi:MAG: beta-glucosidase BglX [Woeseiaceae bacterium]
MSIDLSVAAGNAASKALDERVAALLERMTVAEKIGQMSQADAADGTKADSLRDAVRAGRIGAVLNEVDLEAVNELQRIAVRESRLGIPLLTGRDVIHGFRTVLPIPLGQAASWNPELVRQGARLAALEAASVGINWTFAPMIDISRDPRWGRIAESFGEDVHLTGVLGAAMVRGFQGENLADPGAIAACAKHFAGYGASECGRDYNTTNIPENELRNVYLPPFKAAVDAGVATIMTSFSDLDGVPASGNRFLMTQVLRDEWQYDGFVVSDWGSIEQLTVHGFTASETEAAYEAVTAGVNMEMATSVYAGHLADLLEQGRISMQQLDAMTGDILKCKFRLGLFENPYADSSAYTASANSENLATAKALAGQSIVLLKNRDQALPLEKDALRSLAVIGPMADAPYEQLGTWVFDGDPEISQTPLSAIREFVAHDVDIRYVRAMETSRSRTSTAFAEAKAAADASDAVIVFLGEESILSGEAHSRADIDLPGNQAELVHALHETGRPLIGVIMAGRPLTLANVVDELDAVLYAWHPGTMGGPAIADILFGVEAPSGKLPVTFPSVVGQIPIYYAHKNTGKPPTPESVVHIDDIEVNARQASFGMTSFHLDAGFRPLYPFGYGLSYTTFSYSSIEVSHPRIEPHETVTVQAVVRNDGDVEADEVVQLYVRDRVGNVTRPVRELKGFQRLRLKAGERRTVSFVLGPGDLAFYGRDMRLMTEPGEFHVWIGGSSIADLRTEFSIIDR